VGWDPRDTTAEQHRQRNAWLTIQHAHAVANGLPVVAANRTGHEADPSGASEGIAFWGSSFVAGSLGETLAEAPTEGETVLVTELDLARSEDDRRIWPFLRDRRIDAYGELTKRYID
jgi:N-carbamoylputrescine amidase